MEKYKWLPTESSPSLYPMSIYKGSLVLEDGSSVYIPSSASSHTGWGYSGSLHVQGDDFKALPVKLNVTWASFVEDKFYEGSWSLPIDVIKKHFEIGTTDWRTKEKQNYTSVVVGLAPGGIVVVWLYGNDQQVEIARYQAKETNVAMKDFVPGNPNVTQKEYFTQFAKLDDEDEENERQIKGIQYGIWDIYREKYNWRTIIDIPGQTFERVTFEMYNGEEETLFDDKLKINEFKPRAVPRLISFVFEGKNSIQNVFEIKYLDEEEIFSIFKKLNKNEPIEIILKMNEDLGERKVYIKQGNNEFPLKKINFENMWELKKYQAK